MNTPCISRRGLLPGLVLLALTGCASVKVHDAPFQDQIAAQRGDVLTSGKISAASRESLLVLGLDANVCIKASRACLERLETSRELADERRLATLAELQLAHALAADRPSKTASASPVFLLERYLDVANSSYAYLFFTAREPGERAFEDRQSQVRDYYNYATERVASLAFDWRGDATAMQIGTWQARIGEMRLRIAGADKLQELVPASRLRFDGVRSAYRRDGFGAAFVAIAPAKVEREPDSTVVESRFSAATVILRFPGETLEQVLASRKVIADVFDPLQYDSIRMGRHTAPLAANFTAPYALWLARSTFDREAERALRGRSANLRGPRLYLMQPYDPDRRTIIVLHGLGSSPEGWVNLVNEVMGDESLRRDSQVWQLFYPTNLPIPENVRTIRRTLREAFATFDPTGTAHASRGVTLVGHSMGGVISRLLVVESGDALWQSFFDRPVDTDERARFPKLEPYLTLEPLPQVTRAIFIAAPHRGSPAASEWLGRMASHLVRLPATALRTMAAVADDVAHAAPDRALALRTQRMNSVTNLSDRDGYLRATASLPIASNVAYHSIIGRVDPRVALEQSTDGVVPYVSAHLDGASSELVVASGHSVQETPLAILEIRRILRSDQESPR